MFDGPFFVNFRENEDEDVFHNVTPDILRKNFSRNSSLVQLSTPQHSFRLSSVSSQSGSNCHQAARARLHQDQKHYKSSPAPCNRKNKKTKKVSLRISTKILTYDEDLKKYKITSWG